MQGDSTAAPLDNRFRWSRNDPPDRFLILLTLLEHHFLPGDLGAQLGAFVDHYARRRYHASLGNLTPADVCCGRDRVILQERERIKRQTIERHRLLHRSVAAESDQPDAPEPP